MHRGPGTRHRCENIWGCTPVGPQGRGRQMPQSFPQGSSCWPLGRLSSGVFSLRGLPAGHPAVPSLARVLTWPHVVPPATWTSSSRRFPKGTSYSSRTLAKLWTLCWTRCSAGTPLKRESEFLFHLRRLARTKHVNVLRGAVASAQGGSAGNFPPSWEAAGSATKRRPHGQVGSCETAALSGRDTNTLLVITADSCPRRSCSCFLFFLKTIYLRDRDRDRERERAQAGR